jgi:uncharacterized protein YegP (UPF0339 family)
MAGKFEISAGKTGKFRFSLKASNGQIILTSEAYETRTEAKKEIASVKKNAHNEKLKREIASDEYSNFMLKLANSEPIGKSEMYTTARAMENGIA